MDEAYDAIDFCVRAVDIAQLKKAALEHLKRSGGAIPDNVPFGCSARFQQTILTNKIACVAPVQPAWFNLRQTIPPDVPEEPTGRGTS